MLVICCSDRFFLYRCIFGLGEVGVVVLAFVDLVACSVFAVFYGVFVFFFLVLFALGVLAGWDVGVSWACHTDILTSTTI